MTTIVIDKESVKIDGAEAGPLTISWQHGDPYRKLIFDAVIVKYLAIESAQSDAAVTLSLLQQKCAQLESQLAEAIANGDRTDQEPSNQRYILVQSFRDRFTSEEKAAFLSAARSDDAVFALFFELTTASSPISLDSIRLIEGMAYLVSINVITEARCIEILA